MVSIQAGVGSSSVVPGCSLLSFVGIGLPT